VAEDNSKASILFHESFEDYAEKAKYKTDSKLYNVIASDVSSKEFVDGKHSYKLDIIFHDGKYFYAYFMLPESITISQDISASGWIFRERGDTSGIGLSFLIKRPFSKKGFLKGRTPLPLDEKAPSLKEWVQGSSIGGDLYNEIITASVKILERQGIAPQFAKLYLYCQPPVIDKVYMHIKCQAKEQYTVYIDNIEIKGGREKVDTAARYREKAEEMTTTLRSHLKKVKTRFLNYPCPSNMVADTSQQAELRDLLEVLEGDLSEVPSNLYKWIYLAREISMFEVSVNSFIR